MYHISDTRIQVIIVRTSYVCTHNYYYVAVVLSEKSVWAKATKPGTFKVTQSPQQEIVFEVHCEEDSPDNGELNGLFIASYPSRFSKTLMKRKQIDFASCLSDCKMLIH